MYVCHNTLKFHYPCSAQAPIILFPFEEKILAWKLSFNSNMYPTATQNGSLRSSFPYSQLTSSGVCPLHVQTGVKDVPDLGMPGCLVLPLSTHSTSLSSQKSQPSLNKSCPTSPVVQQVRKGEYNCCDQQQQTILYNMKYPSCYATGSSKSSHLGKHSHSPFMQRGSYNTWQRQVNITHPKSLNHTWICFYRPSNQCKTPQKYYCSYFSFDIDAVFHYFIKDSIIPWLSGNPGRSAITSESQSLGSAAVFHSPPLERQLLLREKHAVYCCFKKVTEGQPALGLLYDVVKQQGFTHSF